MEYTRAAVARPDLQHERLPSHPIVFLDTIVIDRSLSPAPAIVYQLKDDASLDSSSFDNDCLSELGVLVSLCRRTRKVYLPGDKVISYRRLVTVSGPQREHSTQSLSEGAYRTVRHAIRCSHIRKGSIDDSVHNTTRYPSTRYSARLSRLPTTQRLGGLSHFIENRRKEMKAALPNSSHVLGVHSGSNRFYQVQS